MFTMLNMHFKSQKITIKEVMRTQALPAFLKLIETTKPHYHLGDRDWNFFLKLGKKWTSLHVKEYRGIYYISSDAIEERNHSIEFDPAKPSKPAISSKLLEALKNTITEQKREPFSYYAHLQRRLPPSMRMGLIPRYFLRTLIPEYRRFDLELGPQILSRTIELLKNHQDKSIPKMTAGRYFKYCRLAYLANPETHKEGLRHNATGRELYHRFADGRDGGLSKLKLGSEQAFTRWYYSKEWDIGHPWEIFRGGNSTHINLAVVHNHSKVNWQIQLNAFSSTRASEACRIALAFNKAGLPFTFNHRESYLNRLLEQDWVGILPESDSIKSGWHQFPEKHHVSDCIHFSWFRDEHGKTVIPLHKIRQLVTWLPITGPLP